MTGAPGEHYAIAGSIVGYGGNLGLGQVTYYYNFRNRTVRFLAHHKKCNIGIRDEYGRVHPVKEENDAPPGLPSE